jgi:hypothetical protein
MIKHRILIKDSVAAVSGATIPATIPMSLGSSHLDGRFIGEFTEFRNLEFGKRLNDYGTCQFDVPTTDTKLATLLSLRKNKVYIYRSEDDGAGVLVWAGEMALSQGRLVQDENNWITIYSYTWLEQLKHRFTAASVTFDDIDQGQIAWSLINTTQAESSFGITQGTIPATKSRDRTYYNQNIYEAIINLSNVLSGFDFEITDEKAFNAQSIIGEDKTDEVQFIYGVNIREATIEESFLNPVNRAIVLGQPTDDTSLVREDSNDASAQAEYKLRENVLSEMDVSDTGTLQDKGLALLRKRSAELMKVEFVPSGSTGDTINIFGAGDSVYVKISDGFYDIEGDFRVYEWSVRYDSNDVEHISLVLGDFILIPGVS